MNTVELERAGRRFIWTLSMSEGQFKEKSMLAKCLRSGDDIDVIRLVVRFNSPSSIASHRII